MSSGKKTGRCSFLSLGVDGLSLLARIFPFKIFHSLTMGAMDVFYLLFGKKLRRVARESLHTVWKNALSAADIDRVSREAYRNLVSGFVGHAYVEQHPAMTDEVFEIQGRDELDRALKEGKGAVIAIAHFGPFTWMLCKFARLGYKTNIVMRPLRDAAAAARIARGARRLGKTVIPSVPVRDCVTACFAALERGELVFLPIDQNYGGKGRVFVDFFGKQAGTATGPAVFALKTGAPIFFVYAEPLPMDPQTAQRFPPRFRIVISPRIPLAAGGSDRDRLIATTAVLTRKVEEIIRHYPGQWSWMHRRWKTRPRDGEM